MIPSSQVLRPAPVPVLGTHIAVGVGQRRPEHGSNLGLNRPERHGPGLVGVGNFDCHRDNRRVVRVRSGDRHFVAVPGLVVEDGARLELTSQGNDAKV